MFKKAIFNINESPFFKGYTEGRHWNGWATPYFEKFEKDRLNSIEIQWCNNGNGCLCNDEGEEYIPSSTNSDYSPSNPWNAPGMNISDFI